MANIEKIVEYNNGTLWPYNYDETYLATKHVQAYPLELKDNLMEELRKVARVMGRLDESAPHEVLLVLDAGTGQNAIN